jgi:alanine racemase
MRPTWAEISLPVLRHNFRALQQFVAPNATVCAVVKADAYGHGAAECARVLEKEGATWFGVTSTEEGVQLRQAGITSRILLLAGFWRGEEEAVIEYRLTPAIWERNHIELLEQAAQKMETGSRQTVPVHLKVDTGMARLGVNRQDLAAFTQVFKSARHVVMEGVFTHLAAAEVIDAPGANAQVGRFEEDVAALIEGGLSPVYCHMANSGAIAARPNTWKNMVRPGLALYGYHLPFTSVVTGTPDSSYELPVQPVLSWKTRIVSLRQVAAHQPLGYSGAYVTQAPAKIAVLPVGYADGLNRQLSSCGRVIVRGEYAAIVGNVSMDLTIIDVTGVSGADIGDEVLLLGAAGPRHFDAWDHASLSRTIPYEVLCNISKRVPRKYVE